MQKKPAAHSCRQAFIVTTPSQPLCIIQADAVAGGAQWNLVVEAYELAVFLPQDFLYEIILSVSQVTKSSLTSPPVSPELAL